MLQLASFRYARRHWWELALFHGCVATTSSQQFRPWNPHSAWMQPITGCTMACLMRYNARSASVDRSAHTLCQCIVGRDAAGEFSGITTLSCERFLPAPPPSCAATNVWNHPAALVAKQRQFPRGPAGMDCCQPQIEHLRRQFSQTGAKVSRSACLFQTEYFSDRIWYRLSFMRPHQSKYLRENVRFKGTARRFSLVL